MKDKKDITKVEETVMLAIWKLGGNAYGVTIKNHIKTVTQREYLYSTLYTTLEQLESKGYISRSYGEPSQKRGGKRKIYFSLAEEGHTALKNAFMKQKAVWSGITEESFNKSRIK